jgi:hypothetical protein
MRRDRPRPNIGILAALAASVGLESADVDSRTPKIRIQRHGRVYGQGRGAHRTKAGPGRRHARGRSAAKSLPEPSHAIDCQKNATVARNPDLRCNCFRERPEIYGANSMRAMPAWSHPDFKKFLRAAGATP